MSKRISADNVLIILEELRQEWLTDSPSAQMVCEHLERELLDRVAKKVIDLNDTIVEFH